MPIQVSYGSVWRFVGWPDAFYTRDTIDRMADALWTHGIEIGYAQAVHQRYWIDVFEYPYTVLHRRGGIYAHVAQEYLFDIYEAAVVYAYHHLLGQGDREIQETA